MRLKQAPLLGVSATSREVSKFKSLPWDDMDAQAKLIARTGLSEQKVILGWMPDYRWMTITLPENKFVTYSKAISNMLSRGWDSSGELETNIGWWVHLGQMVPSVPLFPQQVTFSKATCREKKKGRHKQSVSEKIMFLLFVLQQCCNGIDQNLIPFRCLTHIYSLDSCPTGLGGYSNEGYAWRYYLLDNLKFWASNNLLKHLAAIITLWIDILVGRLNKGNCTLLMTDSTTLEGWVWKTNFIKDGKDQI